LLFCSFPWFPFSMIFHGFFHGLIACWCNQLYLLGNFPTESRLGLAEVASLPTAKAGERRLKCVEAPLGSESTFPGRGAEFRFPASSCPPFRDCRGPEVPRVIVWSCLEFLLSWHRLEQGIASVRRSLCGPAILKDILVYCFIIILKFLSTSCS
jgi:hypothetical protein